MSKKKEAASQLEIITDTNIEDVQVPEPVKPSTGSASGFDVKPSTGSASGFDVKPSTSSAGGATSDSSVE